MIEIFGCLLKLEYLAKFSHLCVNNAWEGLKGPLSILTTFASKMGFYCSSKYVISIILSGTIMMGSVTTCEHVVHYHFTYLT
jgi:hypothetical protein